MESVEEEVMWVHLNLSCEEWRKDPRRGSAGQRRGLGGGGRNSGCQCWQGCHVADGHSLSIAEWICTRYHKVQMATLTIWEQVAVGVGEVFVLEL